MRSKYIHVYYCSRRGKCNEWGCVLPSHSIHEALTRRHRPSHLFPSASCWTLQDVSWSGPSASKGWFPTNHNSPKTWDRVRETHDPSIWWSPPAVPLEANWPTLTPPPLLILQSIAFCRMLTRKILLSSLGANNPIWIAYHPCHHHFCRICVH